MGRISTHVLDTAHGCPAAGMDYALYFLPDQGEAQLLAQGQTNADGRTEAPLASGRLQVGRYLLRFDAGAYFRRRDLALPEPPFIDIVALHFGVAEADAAYHVPLLISPWSYSTYRGS